MRPSIEHPNAARGRAMREALLAIIRSRHAAGLRMPSYRLLAAAVGCSEGQVTRHLNRLMDEGAYRPVPAGRHSRIEMGCRP